MRLITHLVLIILSTLSVPIRAQQAANQHPGIIVGNLIDEKQAAVAGASVELTDLADTTRQLRGIISDATGAFAFSNLAFGWYRVSISSVGLQPLQIDSIQVRAERFDFSLNDLVLHPAGDQLQEVVVYAEKPLIQSREGNITFNAAESPLSAGSSASDLLKNVPLIAADPDGNLTVKGKEPRILIDEKPVELNAQQLQDFLESLPGSMIERIEVMTNPPPQYANEPGGVINIVTRKGKVGKTGRLSTYAGTRGESGINGSASFRKRGFSLNLNAGIGFNRYLGEGYSRRENQYADSSNYLNTDNTYKNRNQRPSARLSMEYDFNERNTFTAVAQVNQNNFSNFSQTVYTSLDRYKAITLMSRRQVRSEGDNLNPSLQLTYTHRGKKPGETLRFFASANLSHNQNDRYFFQEFLQPDFAPTGIDSTQQQFNDSHNQGLNLRVSYDKLLSNEKTSISLGAFTVSNSNEVDLVSEYLDKPNAAYAENPLLSNDFRFRQSISELRGSVKQRFGTGMSITAGLSAAFTQVKFDLFRQNQQSQNQYWTFLPFARFNKQWEEVLELNFAYRRSIRRPGMRELNPSIDYGDPYNLRFGNTGLNASTAHNFDLMVGRNTNKYYLNLNFGFNLVQDVFAQIRTLQADGKTVVTYQNIDDRQELEVSTWNGYNFSRKLRLNFSASYSYNRYSAFDRETYRYRNGGSFNSNLNLNYAPQEVWNFNSSFTFNRFANPQGYARWNTSMNIGLQRKFFQKRFIVTINCIDPIRQQRNRSFTYGPDFTHEYYNYSQTRNYRLTLTYNFIPVRRK